MSLIAIPAVTASRRLRLDPLAWLTAGKVTVGCVLASSFVVPAAGGFHGQALWLRGVVYPIGLTVLPLIWAARGRGRYPLAADAYLLVPFAFDAAGNSLGLYGRIDNFDNFSHLVGTIALTGFAGALLAGLLGFAGGFPLRLIVLAVAGALGWMWLNARTREWYGA